MRYHVARVFATCVIFWPGLHNSGKSMNNWISPSQARVSAAPNLVGGHVDREIPGPGRGWGTHL